MISYAITVKDEIKEIKHLISLLSEYVPENGNDEIIVLWDSRGDLNVWEYLCSVTNINLQETKGVFNKNFSEWKNYLNSLCNNEFIFNIDADEYPSDLLLNNLKNIINNNKECDAYWIPRENYVEGITSQILSTWNWRIDEKQRINYPDYQMRLYRNNNNIKWVGHVHEHIHGFKTYSHLPEELCLYHYKNIEKQIKQNKLYNDIGYINN